MIFGNLIKIFFSLPPLKKLIHPTLWNFLPLFISINNKITILMNIIHSEFFNWNFFRFNSESKTISTKTIWNGASLIRSINVIMRSL